MTVFNTDPVLLIGHFVFVDFVTVQVYQMQWKLVCAARNAGGVYIATHQEAASGDADHLSIAWIRTVNQRQVDLFGCGLGGCIDRTGKDGDR